MSKTSGTGAPTAELSPSFTTGNMGWTGRFRDRFADNEKNKKGRKFTNALGNNATSRANTMQW